MHLPQCHCSLNIARFWSVGALCSHLSFILYLAIDISVDPSISLINLMLYVYSLADRDPMQQDTANILSILDQLSEGYRMLLVREKMAMPWSGVHCTKNASNYSAGRHLFRVNPNRTWRQWKLHVIRQWERYSHFQVFTTNSLNSYLSIINQSFSFYLKHFIIAEGHWHYHGRYSSIELIRKIRWNKMIINYLLFTPVSLNI